MLGISPPIYHLKKVKEEGTSICDTSCRTRKIIIRVSTIATLFTLLEQISCAKLAAVVVRKNNLFLKLRRANGRETMRKIFFVRVDFDERGA